MGWGGVVCGEEGEEGLNIYLGIIGIKMLELEVRGGIISGHTSVRV